CLGRFAVATPHEQCGSKRSQIVCRLVFLGAVSHRSRWLRGPFSKLMLLLLEAEAKSALEAPWRRDALIEDQHRLCAQRIGAWKHQPLYCAPPGDRFRGSRRSSTARSHG